MKRSVFNSFRAQMLFNMFAILFILVFSTAYILYSTIRIQRVVNYNFEQQRVIREIQGGLDEFQGPFLEYISSKSSNALAELLIIAQRLRGLIPEYEAIPVDPIQLQEKEAYSAVSAYLDLADSVIEEKRGMDIARYTSLYDEMERVLDYVHGSIESISSARFAAQLDQYETFIAISRDVQLWNLLFIIFISLFSLLFVLQAVARINRPMAKLSETATEIAAGNFDVEDIGMTKLYEIDHVVDAFNRMKRDVRASIEELRWQRNVEKEYMRERMHNLKMEQTVRRMELYTLQAQMNPHFLFNTLNTGVQLAIVEGADRTGEYMEHLAALFRHNLREKSAVVPLRHEIEGLESYFYILRVRFPKNLDLVLDCPEGILDAYKVPVSILQPLVENSVVHAFGGKEGRNSIIVRAYAEGDDLCLSVADNGIGMSADQVSALLRPAQPKDGDEKVMGLENVIQRLRFYFPDDPDVIDIHSQLGQGTEIVIRIDTRKELCIAL
jgi:sensor histidine kinase YesM